MEKEIIVVPAVDCLPQSVCEIPILYSSLIFRVDYIFAQSLRRKPTTIIIETEKKTIFGICTKTKKKTKETKLLRGFLRWISDIAKDVRLTDEMLWQRVNDTIYLRSYFFLLFFAFWFESFVRFSSCICKLTEFCICMYRIFLIIRNVS